jgi:hypothetical protein
MHVLRHLRFNEAHKTTTGLSETKQKQSISPKQETLLKPWSLR